MSLADFLRLSICLAKSAQLSRLAQSFSRVKEPRLGRSDGYSSNFSGFAHRPFAEVRELNNDPEVGAKRAGRVSNSSLTFFLQVPLLGIGRRVSHFLKQIGLVGIACAIQRNRPGTLSFAQNHE